MISQFDAIEPIRCDVRFNVRRFHSGTDSRSRCSPNFMFIAVMDFGKKRGKGGSNYDCLVNVGCRDSSKSRSES